MSPRPPPSVFLVLLVVCRASASLVAQDTTVVRSDDPPVWASPHLMEELRIGVLEGDEHYVFGQVRYVVPTADGSVWTVDAQGPRVRIYDRDGGYVRDVSRPGEGPGEIASVMGIDLTPEGRVAVWDLKNARVSLYLQDGEYEDAFRAVSGWWTDESFQVDRAGRFWVFTSIDNPECLRTYTAPDGTTRQIGSEEPGCQWRAYLRFAPSGEPIDTLFLPVPETERVPSFMVMLPEGGVQPFVPEWSWALSPLGYLVTAFSMRYAIHLLAPGPGGTAVTTILRAYQPVRLTRGERAQWQARADFYSRTLSPGDASHGVQIPDEKPPLRSVDVDHDGRIWVNRYVAAEERTDVEPQRDPERPPALTWREPPTFDVFEPSGRFLGTVKAPRNVRILWRHGDVLWGVLRGRFDEDYVVRYRLMADGG